MKGRRVAAAVLAMLFLLAQRAWAVDISATAAVLMDADTGRILYEKNPDRRMLVGQHHQDPYGTGGAGELRAAQYGSR